MSFTDGYPDDTRSAQEREDDYDAALDAEAARAVDAVEVLTYRDRRVGKIGSWPIEQTGAMQ